MRKIFSVFFVSLVLALLSGPVSAAYYSLTPATTIITPGENFSLAVTVVPQKDEVHQVNFTVSYPTDLIKVDHFSLSEGWVPSMSVASGGVLSVTAEYPEGILSPQTLATIRFTALSVGTADLDFESSSFIKNESGANVKTSANGALVKIMSEEMIAALENQEFVGGESDPGEAGTVVETVKIVREVVVEQPSGAVAPTVTEEDESLPEEVALFDIEADYNDEMRVNESELESQVVAVLLIVLLSLGMIVGFRILSNYKYAKFKQEIENELDELES